MLQLVSGVVGWLELNSANTECTFHVIIILAEGKHTSIVYIDQCKQECLEVTRGNIQTVFHTFIEFSRNVTSRTGADFKVMKKIRSRRKWVPVW